MATAASIAVTVTEHKVIPAETPGGRVGAVSTSKFHREEHFVAVVHRLARTPIKTGPGVRARSNRRRKPLIYWAIAVHVRLLNGPRCVRWSTAVLFWVSTRGTPQCRYATAETQK